MTRQPITISQLIARHDVLLFDAYGVLVRSDGAIKGAPELIAHLNAIAHPYFVLTNDASRLIPTSVKRYHDAGLAIPQDRVITSGSLLTRYFADNDLVGAPTLALGRGDAAAYVDEAGGVRVELAEDARVNVVVIGELTGPTLQRDLELTLTVIVRHLDAGEPLHLVVPNPDLIYPRSEHSFGLTAGSAARLLEAILHERYPGRAVMFDRLGKPHPFIYEEGLVRAGITDRRRAVMIGDQLATDVAGALRVGLEAALVTTGLIALEQLPEGAWPAEPTYLLHDLSLE